MSDYQNYPPPVAPPANPTSTMAIVSLVSGILGWTLVPLLGSVVAVITGQMAKNEIRRSGGALTGDGLATAGLILGWVAIALGVLGCILFLVLPMLGIGGLALCAPFMNGINVSP